MHSLSALSFSDLQFPADLSAFLSMLSLCEWVVTTQCLMTVSLINCGLEIGRLLPELVKCGSGFAHLDFTGNSFLQPINVILPTITDLNVSRCQFTTISLVSLFEGLSMITDHEVRLTATSLSGIDDEFYIDVMWIQLVTLISLIWNCNPLSVASFACFCAFLKNQPKLAELSIAGCLPMDQFSVVSPLLVDFFNCKRMESVNLADNRHGKALIPAIEAVLGSPTLCSLDISGTLVGDDFINRVLSICPGTLTIFRFGCSSAERLVAAVKKVIANGNIKVSVWPQEDADQFQGNGEIEVEQKNFAAKFGRFAGRQVIGERTAVREQAKKMAVKETRSGKGSIQKNRSGLPRYADYDGYKSRQE
jgi:hypothetical protein